MGKRIIVFFTSLLFVSHFVFAQTSILDAGIRMQKTPNLYNENGIALAYSYKKLMPDKLYFGLSYVTSRLGTALNSNAIKQDNMLVSAAYFFKKNHRLRPFLRANSGYFLANYGEPQFDVLPNSSVLLSADGGLSYKGNLPLKVAASLGYNFITGDGMEGPGTLYPVFYQVSLSWRIMGNNKIGSDAYCPEFE